MKSYSSLTLALITFYSTSCAQNTPENNAQSQNTLSQSSLSPSVPPNQYACTHPSCNKTFVNSSVLRRHKHTHKLDIALVLTQLQSNTAHAQPSIQQTPPLPVPSRYTCPHSGCNQNFANNGALRRHQTTHKNPKPYQCIQCKKRFSRKYYLTQHTLIHTDPGALTCTHASCNKRFSTERDLARHTLIHTAPGALTCTHCKKIFSNKSNLRAHTKRKHLSLSNLAPVSAQLQSDATHAQPSIQHTPPPVPPTSYAYAHPGYNHTFTNLNPATASTQLQNYLMHTQSSMPQTPLSSVSSKSYTCLHAGCNQTFISIEALRRHNYIHQGFRPYQCRKCKKRFQSKNRLVKHMEKHTHSKNLQCMQCNERFTYVSDLSRHMRKHNNNPKAFTCTHTNCDKAYTNKQNLTRHMLIHTRPHGFECTQCNKRYTNQYSLTQHMLTHTNSEDFICTQCNKAFQSIRNLERHMLIHTNPKSFACTYCNRRFTHKGSLTRHMLIHTNPNALICAYCNRRFTTKSHLTRHMRTQHQLAQP